MHQHPFRPAPVERAVCEAKLHRVPHFEGDGQTQAGRSSLGLGNHRRAHIYAGNCTRRTDAPRDVDHVGSGSAADVEHRQPLAQVQAVEHDWLALLDVRVSVALVEEADKEVGVTGSIDLGEEGYILVRHILPLFPPTNL